ncbi:unnamed protein product [Ectocarpus sp. 13 AM-2016]
MLTISTCNHGRLTCHPTTNARRFLECCSLRVRLLPQLSGYHARITPHPSARFPIGASVFDPSLSSPPRTQLPPLLASRPPTVERSFGRLAVVACLPSELPKKLPRKYPRRNLSSAIRSHHMTSRNK